nr:helix-turn-helix domain-containing protein [Moraxella catarrhalis]
MNDPQNTIIEQGLRLKLRRKALGLSAEALASKMSELGVPVSRGAIANWECGKNGIVMSKLPILAAALGVSESYLLSGDHLTLQKTKQKTVNEIWPKSTLIKSSINQTPITLSSEYAIMPQTKPLKNPINLPMFATIFVVSYYKPPTVWKLKVSGLLSSTSAILPLLGY